MNLVASAMLRGMVGASSSADPSGVPGNRKARSAYGSNRAAPVYGGGEDARAALKGVLTGSDPGEKSGGREASGWNPFHSGSDVVQISDAGRSTPGASAAQPASQGASKAPQAGSKLSIKA